MERAPLDCGLQTHRSVSAPCVQTEFDKQETWRERSFEKEEHISVMDWNPNDSFRGHLQIIYTVSKVNIGLGRRMTLSVMFIGLGLGLTLSADMTRHRLSI